MYRHTLCYCTMPIVSCRNCVFNKLKVCGNRVSSKSVGAIFPTALAHFIFLFHILIILTIFSSIFSIIVFAVVICYQ